MQKSLKNKTPVYPKKRIEIKFLLAEIDVTIYAIENVIGELNTIIPRSEDEEDMLLHAKRVKEKLLEIEKIKFCKMKDINEKNEKKHKSKQR